MDKELRYYNICSPCGVAELGNYSRTNKPGYLDKLSHYSIVPLHQPMGFNRIYTNSSTAMDTNMGVGMIADPSITNIYPEDSSRTEALVVCGYEPRMHEIDGKLYSVWEIRQYQTMAFPSWDNRNRLFNNTLGFFDYKRALRDYVLQLAYFRADQIGDVDFVAETIGYHNLDNDAYYRAVEIGGDDQFSSEIYRLAHEEIRQHRVEELTALGLDYPLIRYGRTKGEEYIHSMAIWVGDIVPNEQVQNTMALSIGYPGGEYYRS
jgi:hypothetical protein